MKIKVRRAAPAVMAAQPEDTTTEFTAGTEQRVNRRTTVTVERETVSFLRRRPVVEKHTAGAAEPPTLEDAPAMPDKFLTAPEMPDAAGESKP